MSNIFFDYRKKKIWDDVAIFMKACGYEDRDGKMCKTRVHTLTSAYTTYLDSKRNTTGTVPYKKPPCFDELDAILSDKPTVMPHFSANFSRVTGEGSKEPDSFDGENLATSDIDMAEEILNSIQINILSSAPSPPANLAPSEHESSESSSHFYFNKSKKIKTKVNHEEWHDKLSQSISSFMTTQAQNDK